jgi:hypothetical protein
MKPHQLPQNSFITVIVSRQMLTSETYIHEMNLLKHTHMQFEVFIVVRVMADLLTFGAMQTCQQMRMFHRNISLFSVLKMETECSPK